MKGNGSDWKKEEIKCAEERLDNSSVAY